MTGIYIYLDREQNLQSIAMSQTTLITRESKNVVIDDMNELINFLFECRRENDYDCTIYDAVDWIIDYLNRHIDLSDDDSLNLDNS